MNTIYKIGVNDGFSSICIDDINTFPALDRLHFERLGENWEVLDFHFLSEDSNILPVPDVASVARSLVFRPEIKEILFPEDNPNIEFLEISVSGERWFILNCLISTAKMDQKRSSFSKSISGQIFSFYKLIVVDSGVQDVPFFTIDGSNRANLFVLDSFVSRFNALGLQGVDFMEIGELEFSH
jgi:hypothetical protein